MLHCAILTEQAGTNTYSRRFAQCRIVSDTLNRIEEFNVQDQAGRIVFEFNKGLITKGEVVRIGGMHYEVDNISERPPYFSKILVFAFHKTGVFNTGKNTLALGENVLTLGENRLAL